MKKVTKVCFVVILAILLLAILICPDYITNPVGTFLTFHLLLDGYNKTHMMTSYRPSWYVIVQGVVSSYPVKPILVILTTVLLAILGSCIYCLVRKFRKAYKPTLISAPKLRWKKKAAFGLLLLIIVLVRPNPVMSTLLMPLSFIQTSFSKWNVFGYSPLISGSKEITDYTLITGHLLRIYEYVPTDDGFGVINGSNTFYQSRMILIAIFIAVARLGIVLRDKWLRRTQPSRPQETTKTEEP